MNKSSYFTEVSRVLKKNGIESQQQDSYLLILHDHAVCGILNKQGNTMVPKDFCDTPEATQTRRQAAITALTVKEYVTAMESAPSIIKDRLDSFDDYRMLCDYGGAVLAGKQLTKGHGYKFVTWKWTHGKSGLTLGDYFDDNYIKAKEDFAKRSGLVDQNRLFSDQKLVMLYRSLLFSSDYDLSLTGNDEHFQRSILQQLEHVMPEIREKVLDSVKINFEIVQMPFADIYRCAKGHASQREVEDLSPNGWICSGTIEDVVTKLRNNGPQDCEMKSILFRDVDNYTMWEIKASDEIYHRLDSFDFTHCDEGGLLEILREMDEANLPQSVMDKIEETWSGYAPEMHT